MVITTTIIKREERPVTVVEGTGTTNVSVNSERSWELTSLKVMPRTLRTQIRRSKSLLNLLQYCQLCELELEHNFHMVSISKTNELWYNSGATDHVCNNKSLFKDYNVVNGHEVLTGNNNSSKVTGIDNIELLHLERNLCWLLY